EWVDREVPEQPKQYPEARMFGRLPAHGFYCRHVTGLRLRGVELGAAAAEMRPAIVCDDVQNLDISGFPASTVTGNHPGIRLKQTKSALLTGWTGPAGTKTFLEVAGADSTGVALTASLMSGAEQAVVYAAGAKPDGS